jgi:hypothetical protein
MYTDKYVEMSHICQRMRSILYGETEHDKPVNMILHERFHLYEEVKRTETGADTHQYNDHGLSNIYL